MIAHRLQTARTADRIVVLDSGRIIEAGPPSEVLDAPRHDRAKAFLAAVL